MSNQFGPIDALDKTMNIFYWLDKLILVLF